MFVERANNNLGPRQNESVTHALNNDRRQGVVAPSSQGFPGVTGEPASF